jgi:hypothetical protein
MNTPTMTRDERTAGILARERAKPHEWHRLHAILCLDHTWFQNDRATARAYGEMVDLVAIARRMDELACADGT